MVDFGRLAGRTANRVFADATTGTSGPSATFRLCVGGALPAGATIRAKSSGWVPDPYAYDALLTPTAATAWDAPGGVMGSSVGAA